MRQPDIEIYLKESVTYKDVADWLSTVLGTCSEWTQKGQVWKCTVGKVPVTWMPKAVGKWNSLYLESAQSDIAGRDASDCCKRCSHTGGLGKVSATAPAFHAQHRSWETARSIHL